jgi:dynein heavy chain 2
LFSSNEKTINWQTLYGLFENAIYGGRIDEYFDLKVLRAYLEHYFSEELLNGKVPLSIGTRMPTTTDIKDYASVISKMNEVDTPDYFGLPLNIDKAVQRFNTLQIINSLKVIMQASAEELKFDKDNWAKQLGPIITLWKTLSRSFKDGSGIS